MDGVYDRLSDQFPFFRSSYIPEFWREQKFQAWVESEERKLNKDPGEEVEDAPPIGLLTPTRQKRRKRKSASDPPLDDTRILVVKERTLVATHQTSIPLVNLVSKETLIDGELDIRHLTFEALCQKLEAHPRLQYDKLEVLTCEYADFKHFKVEDNDTLKAVLLGSMSGLTGSASPGIIILNLPPSFHCGTCKLSHVIGTVDTESCPESDLHIFCRTCIDNWLSSVRTRSEGNAVSADQTVLYLKYKAVGCD